MKRIRHRLAAKIAQFRLAERGVAAVEFALILPIMLTLYLGSVEVSTLISVDLRVQSVAGSLGDLVARSDTDISTGTLTDYFTAASGIMAPFAAAGVQQNVTLVQVRNNGTTNIVWSRQYVDGRVSTSTTRIANTPYADMASAMTTVARGNYVIAAEASYSYLPLYGLVIQRPIELYRENFFVPRFGEDIQIN